MHYSGQESSPESDILWLNAVFLIVTPILAAVAAPYYISNWGVHWTEPVALVVLWFATGMGITAGYHRMFSHRSWWAPAPVRAVLLVLGAASWQNSVLAWCESHRLHHHHTDTDRDPHSIEEGFWWAHMLWILVDGGEHDEFEKIPDLEDDPLCAWQHRHYFAISTGFNVAVPVGLGLMTGRIWGMLLWAGLIRVVVLHHLTFFINSLAHMWGTRPWAEEETARDNAFLAVVTLGEGYHNFHHAFPGDYRNGLRWYQFDPTKWFIWTLSKLGLAGDLRRSPIDQRLRRRWQRLRGKYESRMDEWSDSVRSQVEAAEDRLEEALEELRSRRSEWSRRADDVRDQAREELERARIEAETQALEAFRSWRQLLQQTPEMAQVSN
ncbi:MAG: fatty acid desaturase [Bradymonadaceae bacterium]